MVCQIVVMIGDGSSDLDGSGGDFELTLIFGSNTVEPDPQIIAFSTATRASIFTEQFPLPINQSVTVKLKSPNAADTSVWIRTCIYEVGVESIRDDLEEILTKQKQVTNVFDESTSGTGTSGAVRGVIPEKC